MVDGSDCKITVALQADGGQQRWWAFCTEVASLLALPASADTASDAQLAAALRRGDMTLYQHRLPQLVSRLQAVLEPSVLADSASGALHLILLCIPPT